MTWNWDSSQWKNSTKILLGIATIWPLIYMFLFMGSIFSMFLFLPFAANRSEASCGKLDVLQIDRKIRDGQIKELIVSSDEIIAKDRIGTCTYEVTEFDRSTRQEILDDAKEVVNGSPRVEKIEVRSLQPADEPLFVPIGFGVLMIAHLSTMLLMMALLPFYIILAVKNDRLDQTMRIVWVVLACTAGMFSNIVYWYLFIWRKPPSTPAVDSPLGGSAAQVQTG
ncbi:MAG TPA: hypothetical protein VFU37_19220 [Pyrinomonadaceae bacterium]|nr:hypothetical protein [Pyrinomonadaceae bacterium]